MWCGCRCRRPRSATSSSRCAPPLPGLAASPSSSITWPNSPAARRTRSSRPGSRRRRDVLLPRALLLSPCSSLSPPAPRQRGEGSGAAGYHLQSMISFRARLINAVALNFLHKEEQSPAIRPIEPPQVTPRAFHAESPAPPLLVQTGLARARTRRRQGDPCGGAPARLVGSLVSA